ncbi:hypothetical protein [Arabiibacter massiliensis]|uniref:hypothetical protein n=1 Tax=Arabiibacter massiliensis TaxID=1870985 RepID=UPI001E363BAF|nr:hypothetical protein [Arabiibacter massiliensis]
MNRNDERDYRALMDGIEMPDRVRAHVMREARRLREAEEAGRRSGSRQTRAVAAGACTVALVGILAFAATANRPPEHVAAPLANSFALVAYADEYPGAAPGNTVVLGMDDFGFDSAWKVWHSDPEIDPNNADDAPDEGRRYLSVAYDFNLSCVGDNIASLTYTVEGERVLFYTHAKEAQSVARDGADPYTEERGTSFTVDYEDQGSNRAETWRALRVSFPLEGETAELYDEVIAEFYSAAREWDVETHERLNALLIRKYADMVSQASLVLTAAYEDGSTETQTYVIAPVDDLEAKVRAYDDALRAQADSIDPTNPPAGPVEEIPRPALFTLTRIS